MADIELTGDVAKLQRVAKQLKATGDKDLRRELYRGLNRATKPLKAAAKANAAATLPKAGGLAADIAKSKLSTRSRTAGDNVGVRIVAASPNSGHDIAALNRGRLRHPVFGDRNVWVTQEIEPGWFTKPMLAGADIVRDSIRSVLEDLARRIARA